MQSQTKRRQPTPVQSHVLSHVDYDPATKTLEVHFHKGGAYTYANVKPEDHAALMAAPSKTSFFARHIRKHYIGKPKTR